MFGFIFFLLFVVLRLLIHMSCFGYFDLLLLVYCHALRFSWLCKSFISSSCITTFSLFFLKFIFRIFGKTGLVSKLGIQAPCFLYLLTWIHGIKKDYLKCTSKYEVINFLNLLYIISIKLLIRSSNATQTTTKRIWSGSYVLNWRSW